MLDITWEKGTDLWDFNVNEVGLEGKVRVGLCRHTFFKAGQGPCDWELRVKGSVGYWIATSITYKALKRLPMFSRLHRQADNIDNDGIQNPKDNMHLCAALAWILVIHFTCWTNEIGAIWFPIPTFIRIYFINKCHLSAWRDVTWHKRCGYVYCVNQ
jgi:hypothetical protein